MPGRAAGCHQGGIGFDETPAPRLNSTTRRLCTTGQGAGGLAPGPPPLSGFPALAERGMFGRRRMPQLSNSPFQPTVEPGEERRRLPGRLPGPRAGCAGGAACCDTGRHPGQLSWIRPRPHSRALACLDVFVPVPETSAVE